MMNVYQNQAKTKSFNNTDMTANLIKKPPYLQYYLFVQGNVHNNTFNALYILKYICI